MDEVLETNGPVYWRAAHVARALGVSKRLLIDDVAAGRLPVPVCLAHFGVSRIAHINAEDARRLVQALNGKPGAQS